MTKKGRREVEGITWRYSEYNRESRNPEEDTLIETRSLEWGGMP